MAERMESHGKIITLAIEEDVAEGILQQIPLSGKSTAVAEMKAKAPGVISGLDITRKVFEKFDRTIEWTPLVKEVRGWKRGR